MAVANISPALLTSGTAALLVVERQAAPLNTGTADQEESCTPAGLMKVDNATEALWTPELLLVSTSNSTL